MSQPTIERDMDTSTELVSHRDWDAARTFFVCHNCFYKGTDPTQAHCLRCNARFKVDGYDALVTELLESALEPSQVATAVGTIPTPPSLSPSEEGSYEVIEYKPRREYKLPVGWALVAAVIVFGLFAVNGAMKSGMRAKAAVAATPLPVSVAPAYIPPAQDYRPPVQPVTYTCPNCKGLGEVGYCPTPIICFMNAKGEASGYTACPECFGTGEAKDGRMCLHCDGTGKCNGKGVHLCWVCRGTRVVSQSVYNAYQQQVFRERQASEAYDHMQRQREINSEAQQQQDLMNGMQNRAGGDSVFNADGTLRQ